MSFFAELKHRNVLRVAAAYLVTLSRGSVAIIGASSDLVASLGPRCANQFSPSPPRPNGLAPVNSIKAGFLRHFISVI